MESREPEPGHSGVGNVNVGNEQVGSKRKRGPYKGYLKDSSIPIPRTTVISRQQKSQSKEITEVRVNSFYVHCISFTSSF